MLIKSKRLATNLWSACIVLGVCALSSSCARVKISDRELYGDMGSEGAAVTHLFSDERFFLTKEEWDDLRFGMICVQPEALEEWKVAILSLCKATNRCTFEEVKLVRAMGEKLRFLRSSTMLRNPEAAAAGNETLP